jgi:hypothetical protein
MAKLNTSRAYEVAAVNVKRTNAETGETDGYRFAVRTDGNILFRLRYVIEADGTKRVHRSSGYSTFHRKFKKEHKPSLALLLSLLTRLGYERDDAGLTEPKVKPAKAEQPETPQFESLRDKIAWEKEQRAAKYTRYEEAIGKAHQAGMAAGMGASPTPMLVQEHANPLDDNSPVVKTYAPVMGGVCGFAYVTVRPGNSSFALWAKKNKGWFKAYYGGMQMSVRAFGQSMERKEAYARAFVEGAARRAGHRGVLVQSHGLTTTRPGAGRQGAHP